MNEYKKTVNHAMVYSIATILQYGTSIVMLPIYTRYLTPQDYGISELLSMAVEFIGLIVGVVGGQAIFRFFQESNDPDYRKKVIFTAYSIAMLANCIGFLLFASFSKPTADFLFSDTSVLNPQFLVLLYGASMIFQAMTAMPMAYIRALQKPKTFVAFAALRLILAVSANIYFVVYKELNITGVVYSVATFTFLHGLVLSIYLISKVGINFSRGLVKEIFSFSLPLMVSAIALFLASYSDRLFIKVYFDAAEVGLYALAYKFGFILVAFTWAPLQQSWDIRRYEVVKLPNAIEVFQTMFRRTQLFIIFVALIFALYAKDLFRVMAAEEFWGASQLVAIIVFAYVLNTWSNFCLFGIFYQKQTKFKAYAEWVSVFLSFALYVLMIPPLGAMGAAIATFITFSVRTALLNYWATKLYDMQLEWARVILLLVLAAALSSLTLLIELQLFESIVFSTLLLMIFVAIVIFSPLFPAQDRIFVKDIIIHPVTTIKNLSV